jgi:type VI secretion system secreted protein VgrG
VVPWLWFLTRTADCQIFQNISVPDILEKVFKAFGFTDYELNLAGHYPKREYCVQYRETTFNFVSRLMEHEGMFYFFQHEDGKHTMVIGDMPHAYADCVENEVTYDATGHGPRLIDTWEHRYTFRSGKWTHTDYNFETPRTDLLTSSETIIDLAGLGGYELFDYPGEYQVESDGAAQARVRMEEEEAAYDVVTGTGGCTTFSPGGKFTLQEHDAQAEQGKAYVLTSVQHTAREFGYSDSTAGAEYANSFACIPASVAFRPPRLTPRRIVQGPQTAEVTGPPGEEIFIDKYGRVKVHFFWDRYNPKNEKSSCWIRVSENWAGKGWGLVAHPRIGQEVIIDFLEGDPDRPILTGRVYNAEQMPAGPLPTKMNVTGFKSHSTKGGGGYNEITMDDTKGQEKITVHGQHDMGTTIEHDDTLTVHNDRKVTVDGMFTEVIDKDTSITIKTGTYSHDVQTGATLYHVKADLTEDYDANQETTVGDTQTTTVQNEITITSEKASIHVKAGTEVHIEAATEIQLHVGASKFLMKSDGRIELSGTNIAITGGESVNTSGGSITSEAKQDHNIKGAIVKSSGSATNTVSGGMVMLNPPG